MEARARAIAEQERLARPSTQAAVGLDRARANWAGQRTVDDQGNPIYTEGLDYNTGGDYLDFLDQMAADGIFPSSGSSGGGQSSQVAVTPQDRVRNNAIARNEARVSRDVRNTTSSAWDNFGIGGGDWASAWQNAQRPQTDLRSLLGGQMLAGPNTTSGLAGLFNSASGPYGQMQLAAALTAPSRNDAAARRYEADTQKDIAGLKYGTANKIASQLANLIGGGMAPLTGLQTDYGMSAHLKPTDLRRFFERK